LVAADAFDGRNGDDIDEGGGIARKGDEGGIDRGEVDAEKGRDTEEDEEELDQDRGILEQFGDEAEDLGEDRDAVEADDGEGGADQEADDAGGEEEAERDAQALGQEDDIVGGEFGIAHQPTASIMSLLSWRWSTPMAMETSQVRAA